MIDRRPNPHTAALRRQPLRAPARLRCVLAMIALTVGVALAALPILASPSPCAAPDTASTEAQLFAAACR